jgi:putative outer membrane protein
LKNFNYWTPERPTNIPRPIAGKITNRRDSDYWLENGSWVKLKTLSIGYTIPEKLLHKIHFNTCRVYVTCQNLLTISSFSMQDPEYRKDNIWNKGYRGVAAYPNPFAINFGVQFQF